MDDHDSVFRLTHDDFGDLGIPTLSNPQTAIDGEKTIWFEYGIFPQKMKV